MNHVALALDYDGTIATDGVVPPRVLEALARVRSSGRSLIMVTGRELPDLRRAFDRLDLFEQVIVENGALLYVPATDRQELLAARPPPAFLDALRQRAVPFAVGVVIVATWISHRGAVEEIIRDLGLSLDLIPNKGSVMVLPPGIDKGSGVARAAAELGLELRGVVGMGDAENDHALFRACGLGIAVANATDALKAEADAITRGVRGEGVIEVAEAMVADDLARFAPRRRG